MAQAWRPLIVGDRCNDAGMRLATKNAIISTTAVVLAAGALGGRLIGWRVVWHGATGWWTPGWGNLFTVGIAAAAVVAAIVNNRVTLSTSVANFKQAQDAASKQFTEARKDARTEKLRSEIAALMTAIDEQQSTGVKIMTGIVDAMGQVGLPTPLTHAVLPQPTNYEEHYDDMRRAFIAAESDFEDTVSPIYRRIAAHSFGVLMLTDDAEIIRPVKRLDSNTAAEWSFMRDLYKRAKASVGGMQFAIAISEWAQTNRDRETRQAEIQADRDELRRYSLERFSKLEQTP